MRTTNRILSAALAILGAAGALPAHAGGNLDNIAVTGPSEAFPGFFEALVVPIKWDARCMPLNYTLDATPPNALIGLPIVDVDTTRRELQSSMERWNEIRTSFVEMNITSVRDLSGGIPTGAIGGFDFVNELSFVAVGGFLAASPSTSLIQDTDLTPGLDIDGDGDADVFEPGGANGATCNDVDGDGDIEFPAGFYQAGTILDNDIGFNAGVNWNTMPDATSAADIQAVAVHELGHSHGLSHSFVNQLSAANGSGATMFPFINTSDPRSEEEARSLALDDIAWSSFTYPEGSAETGVAAVQRRNHDRPFDKEFGLLTGEVISGTLGGPVGGANVWLQKATGKREVQVGGFSGTVRLLFFPPTNQIFLHPEGSLVNGNYTIPVPQGRYIAGLQSLDGLPAAPGNISLTAQVGGLVGDLDFEEEYWNSFFEGAFEQWPGQAFPLQVRKGQETDSVNFATNVTMTLRNTDGDFGNADFIGYTGSTEGTLYAVRFANADVLSLLDSGSVLHTGLFFTTVVDSSEPVEFKSAMLTTGRVNPDGTADLQLRWPLSRERNFLAQDNDFAPMYFDAPLAVTLVSKLLLTLSPDTDLFLVLEVPDGGGVSGFPPLTGLDSGTVGSSFISEDGGETFVPDPSFNYFFELAATP